MMATVGSPTGVRRDFARDSMRAFVTLHGMALPGTQVGTVLLLARCFAAQGVSPDEAFHKGWTRDGVPFASGRQPNRVLSNVDVRHVAFWLAKTGVPAYCAPSYPELAAAVGLTGHSTIVGGVMRVRRAIAREPFGKLASAARRALTTLLHQEGLR